MTGVESATAASPDVATASAPDAKATGIELDAPAKKKISPWVWVGIAAAAIIVIALIVSSQSTSSGGGGLLMLFGRQTATVPSVVGQTQSQAGSTLSAAGLRVGTASTVATLAVSPGIVVLQSPTAGTVVKDGSAVDLSVSAIPQAKVPDIVGDTQSAASEALAAEGLRVGSVSYTYSSSTDAGKLTAQDPDAGSTVAVGSAVNITVSKGEKQGQVPNVVGMAQNDAQSTIEGAGYKSSVTKASSTSVPAGDVISQSPTAGTVAASGSTVTIKVSTGAPEAPKVSVPDVVGMKFSEAFNALQNAGLKVNIAFAPSTDHVLVVAEQDPTAGTSVDPGTVVTITIGLPSFSFEKPSVEPTTLPAPTTPSEQPQNPSGQPAAPSQQPAVPSGSATGSAVTTGQ